MTGWRIGYLAANEKIVKHVGKLQGQSTSNSTSISQEASIIALNEGEVAVKSMVDEFSPDLIAMSCVEDTFPQGVYLLNQIKDKSKGRRTIVQNFNIIIDKINYTF